MRNLVLLTVGMILLSCAPASVAQEVTLIAPGGMRCAIDRMTPDIARKTGYTLKPTIGTGGGTHQQIVRGEAFDVPVVQPPYDDVIASGNVVKSSEMPLASVAVALITRKGDPKPNISTADALKQTLLAAKLISYPDGAGGNGGAAGVSFDATLHKLGIYDQIQPKVKREAGVAPVKLLTDGKIDLAVTFISEAEVPGVEVVGALPADVSTPTRLVGFVSTHAKLPEAAQAVLRYISSADAAAAYKACGMQPGR